MTQEQFFDWADAQNERYEFDGFQPVAMTGSTNIHNRICHNLWAALRSRLRNGPCEVLGPDAGLATTGKSVRYPDALVTCSKVPGTGRVVPGVVVVFEVVSPSSVRTDHYVKVREYHAVQSIQRDVILESASMDMTVLARQAHAPESASTTLTGDDTLHLPEVSVSVPVAELYSRVELAEVS